MSTSYYFPQFIPQLFIPQFMEPFYYNNNNDIESCPSCPNCRKCALQHTTQEVLASCPNCRKCTAEQESNKSEVEDKCSVGPSYWCSSDENFKQCHGMTNDRSKYQVCKPYMSHKL